MHHREENLAARAVGRVRAGHEMSMRHAGVTNAKAGQDHHSVGTVGWRTLSFNGRLNLGQLIAGSPAVSQGACQELRIAGRLKDRGIEGAVVRYRRADEDWPV